MAEFFENTIIVNDDYGKRCIRNDSMKLSKRGRKRSRNMTKTPSSKDHEVTKKCVKELDIQEATSNLHEQVDLLEQISADIYVDLLCRRKSIVPVEANYQAFFMQVLDASPYEKCFHIEAVSKITSKFDDEIGVKAQDVFITEKEESNHLERDHSYGLSKPEKDCFSLEDIPSGVCWRWKCQQEIQYSVVECVSLGKDPHFKCISCKSTSCKHVKELLDLEAFNFNSDLPTAFIKAFNAIPKMRSRYVPVSVSKSKIPITLLNGEKKTSDRKSGNLSLFPTASTGMCECGAEWGHMELYQEMPLVKYHETVMAKVHFQRCQMCDKINEYDGCQDGILNMGKYLIDHCVLRSYMRQFLLQGTTLSSFYKQLAWTQLDSEISDFTSILSYYRFRHSWYSFLKLLNIEYEHGFSCRKCGDCPETVVMDGKTLGTKKLFLPWKKFLCKKNKPTLDGSSHNMRVFVNNQAARTLLMTFSKSDLNQNDFDKLVHLLQLYQPALNKIFQHFNEIKAFTCPTPLKDLMRCLASNYPVCGFLHFHGRVFEVLENMALKQQVPTACDIFLLEQQIPILTKLFKHLHWELPEYLQPVVIELVCKAKVPYERECHDLPQCDESCSCSGYGYFPTLKKNCHRGDYVMDNRTTKVDLVCYKRKTTNPSLLPGIFTISCIHGICYGFEIMENVASPNVPFTILRTRFQTAPRLIIYDNACNLHSYCLNRDPVFFMHSWFVVDKFHWCNHVGCHVGYSLDSYFQFANVNTQVAEKRNATFKCLKSMLSNMNLENFINHVKFFVWFRSMLNLANFNQALPGSNLEYFKALGKFLTT